jgi:hypothetical protein
VKAIEHATTARTLRGLIAEVRRDAGLLLDLLYGPAYHRLFQGHLALGPAFVAGVADAIVAAASFGAL